MDITLTVTLTDNDSGVCISSDCGSTYHNSPTSVTMASEGNTQSFNFINFTRVSGNDKNGTYSATITLPRGAKSGTWTGFDFLLVDKLGNSTTIVDPNISFENTALTWDNQAPSFRDLSITPNEFNTDNRDVTLVLSITVSDNQAGVCTATDCGDFVLSSQSQIRIKAASGSQSLTFSNLNRTSGTDLNGTYTSTGTLQKGSLNGTWVIDTFLLKDKLGNSVSPTSDLTLNNTATIGDRTPPTISSFNITPTQIDTSTNDAELTLTMNLADNAAGICIPSDCGYYENSQTQVILRPLIGTQMLDFTSFTRTSGTDLSGTYTSTITIPAHSKEGIWSVYYLYLVDKLGNRTTYWASDLNNIPNSSGITIANTAEATSVSIDRGWIIRSANTNVFFPEGTIVKKKIMVLSTFTN